jgi:hypothetical protein
LAPFGQAVSEEKICLTVANQKQELPLAEQDEMKKLYRGSYIDASCQVWLHLPSSFRGEDFFNSSQSETGIALGGHICWQNGTN